MEDKKLIIKEAVIIEDMGKSFKKIKESVYDGLKITPQTKTIRILIATEHVYEDLELTHDNIKKLDEKRELLKCKNCGNFQKPRIKSYDRAYPREKERWPSEVGNGVGCDKCVLEYDLYAELRKIDDEIIARNISTGKAKKEDYGL